MAQRVDVLLQRVVVDAAEAKRQLDQYGRKAQATGAKVKQTNVSAVKSYDDLRASINKIAIRLGVVAVAFVAVNKAMSRQREVTNLARGFETLTRRVGETSNVMLGKMRKASRGWLTDAELMKQANTAIILGLPVTADKMGELTEAALKLGRAMGVDANKSLESLIVGIGRQSRLWLDNIGIVVDAEATYKRLADQLGVTVSDLTEAQKKAAFFEETVTQARLASQGLNLETQDLAGHWDRATVAVKNFFDELAKAGTEEQKYKSNRVERALAAGIKSKSGTFGFLGPLLYGIDQDEFDRVMNDPGFQGPAPDFAGRTSGDAITANESIIAENQQKRIAALKEQIDAIRAQRKEWEYIDNVLVNIDATHAELYKEFTAAGAIPLLPPGAAEDIGLLAGEPPTAGRLDFEQQMHVDLLEMQTRNMSERFAAENELLDMHYDGLREKAAVLGADTAAIEQMYSRERIKLAEMEKQQKIQSAMATISVLGGALATLFNDNKIAAVANTIVNTAQGIMACMGLGPAGWVAAGITAAAGASNIAKIMSTEPGSGGSAPSATSITPSASPIGFGGGGGGQTVHIFIEGTGFIQDTSEFARTISQAIEEQRAQAGIN